MKTSIIVLITAIVIVFNSCGVSNHTTANTDLFEDPSMNTVSLNEVEEIIFNGHEDFQIILKKSNKETSLLGNFDVTPEGKKLVVTPKQGIIVINANKLPKIFLNGSSDISVSDESGLEVNFTINGSGDIAFNGRSDRATINSNGSGDISSENFKVERLSLISKGSGDSNVYASVQANVILDGSGNVTVKGSPKLINKMGKHAYNIK